EGAGARGAVNAWQCKVLYIRVGHHLIGEHCCELGEVLGAHAALPSVVVLGATAAGVPGRACEVGEPLGMKCGFSQMTVAPMPRPMHMVVMPYCTEWSSSN